MEFELKKQTFIPLLLLILCAPTPHTTVAAPEPDIDLQTLIAGIKHFDEAVTSGKGAFVYNHQLRGEDTRTYAFTFDGMTFEEAQLRVDYSTDKIVTEIWDGERQWEIYEAKEMLFSVDISPTDYERLNKPKPELPPPVKQQLKAHDIHISGDFRIQKGEEDSYAKLIDNVTEHNYYIYYTEEYFSFYTIHLKYGVRPGCVIHAHLDPRYWMTFGKVTPSSYLMTPLWEVLENNESEILQTEMCNGEEMYLISVQHPKAKSLKLWISPEKGFRLVKLQNIFEVQEETPWMPFKKGVRYFKERILHYREYLPGVWFPEKVEETIHSLLVDDPKKKGDRIGKTTLQAITCELNIDVSAVFQLDVTEDTPVYDYGVGKLRPFRELKQPSQ